MGRIGASRQDRAAGIDYSREEPARHERGATARLTPSRLRLDVKRSMSDGLQMIA